MGLFVTYFDNTAKGNNLVHRQPISIEHLQQANQLFKVDNSELIITDDVTEFPLL